MGKIIKKIFKRADRLPGTPGAGGTSKSFTGLTSGIKGSAAPANESNLNRRPGRRGADTPLGPGRQRM